MTFQIKKPSVIKIYLLKRYLTTLYKTRINKYNFNLDEIKLDNYIQKNYNLSLKDAGIKIINNIIILDNSPETAIIKIKDKFSNSLAQLITYGNLEVKGTNILYNIFN
jgi:hypothetical protein